MIKLNSCTQQVYESNKNLFDYYSRDFLSIIQIYQVLTLSILSVPQTLVFYVLWLLFVPKLNWTLMSHPKLKIVSIIRVYHNFMVTLKVLFFFQISAHQPILWNKQFHFLQNPQRSPKTLLLSFFNWFAQLFRKRRRNLQSDQFVWSRQTSSISSQPTKSINWILHYCGRQSMHF